VGRKSPPEPTYFLDENMEARDVARLLRTAGLQCVRLSEAGSDFFKGLEDTKWIELAAARGWWGVTRDGRTLTNVEERAAIRRSQAVHIYLRGQDLGIEAMAHALIVAHKNRRLAARIDGWTRPAIVVLQPDGDFKFDGGEKKSAIKR
jgi:hypothetical protein